MNLLLTAATPAELSPTLTWLRERARSSEQNILSYASTDIHVLFTGMGTIATTFALTDYLANHRVALAVQAGIAGALDSDIQLGDVVRVGRERQLDFGAEERDGTWLQLPDMGFAYAPPYDTDGWLRPDDAAAHHLPFREVIGGTTNRTSGTRESIARLRRHYPAVQVESMEGAAFFYTCMQANVKPLQLRAISNYVTERDRASWQIGPAIAALDRALRDVLAPFVNE